MAEITAQFFRSVGYREGRAARRSVGTITFEVNDPDAAAVLEAAAEKKLVFANDIGMMSKLAPPEEITGNRYPWRVCAISGGDQWASWSNGGSPDIYKAAAKATRIIRVELTGYARG